MLRRLLDNWFYKFLALVFAIALHFYASNLLNPPQSRPVPVAVTPRSLPSGVFWDQATAPQVTVTLTGSAEQLGRIPDSAVRAVVDLSSAQPGRPLLAPVRAQVTGGGAGVGIEVQPASVSLTLPARSARTLPVEASAPSAPPAGYAFHAPVVRPRQAKVEGSRDVVSEIRRLVVRVDAPESIGTIDSDGPIVALDAQNNPIPDVTITPQTASVHIEMVKAPAAKRLIVSAALTGTPPYPYRITGVDVNPVTVTVTGPPDRLARSGTIETAPVDVSGAIGDVTRAVGLTVPAGLRVVGSPSVSVTVHIAPLSVPPPVPQNGPPASNPGGAGLVPGGPIPPAGAPPTAASR